MRIAYFGAPTFSAGFLKRILEETEIDVSLVVTQPDKKVGRKQVLTPTPVKVLAQEHGIELFDEDDITVLPELLSKKGIELALLFAYGKILPKSLLQSPKNGFWNIHPSLLPHYRGASPLVFPLLLSDTITGVSLAQMDEMLDHGPIIASKEYVIMPADTRKTLEATLMNLGFNLFKESVVGFAEVVSRMEAQDHAQATFTSMQRKDDGYIELTVIHDAINTPDKQVEKLPKVIERYYQKNTSQNLPHYSAAHLVYNMYRGLIGWPGVWTTISVNGEDKRLKITAMELSSSGPAITKVQLEGKTEVDLSTFLRAYSL